MIKKKLLIVLVFTWLIANNTLSTGGMQREYLEKSKRKKEKKSLAKPLLFLAGSAIVVVGGIWWYNRSSEEIQTDKVLEALLKSTNKTKIREDVVIPKNHLLTQDPDHISVTEFNYSNPKLFDILGVRSDDILLMNGANPRMLFGGGGTNKALSILINKLTGRSEWGVMKDLKFKDLLGPAASLVVGGLCLSTTNVPNKPKINVIHVLGPDKVNTQSTQHHLRQGMREAVLCALNNNKHIMVCAVSTGLYSSGEKMTNDMYQACWTGIAAAIQIYRSNHPNTPLPSNIYLNLWHRDVIQHITNKKLYRLRSN